MMSRMLLGEDRADDEAARAQWTLDSLPECHNDDALWGFAIRSSVELEKTPIYCMDDPVLYRLFRIGLFDWPGKGRLQGGVLRGIRYTSVVASRLFGRILRWEQKVLLPYTFLCRRV